MSLRILYHLGILCVSAAVTITAYGAPAEPAAHLFGDSIFADVPLAKSVIDHRTNVRERVVHPDLALIDTLALARTEGAGSTFTLDLFPDVTLIATVVHTAPTAFGGTTIHAQLVGLPLGTAVLTHDGGYLSGLVSWPGGVYEIRPVADGIARIAQIAQQNYPPEKGPIVVHGAAPTAADRGPSADPPVDTGHLIDVLVVWDSAAETAAGGSAAIQSTVTAAVADANAAYLNSGIAQRLRLVASQLVTYTEVPSCSGGTDAFTCALNDVTNSGNALGDAVHALRDANGADEVVFLINDLAFCGLAWLPDTISSANDGLGFAVVNWSCAVGNHSFAHELGHNMGAHHDPYVDPGPGILPFEFGHGLSHIGATLGTSWRTVMAYNNECAANFGGGFCTRVQYFSNPNINYSDGNAMGDGPERDNALVLNLSANAVSNYRATVVPITATFTDVPISDPFFGWIEFMVQSGISNGCNAVPKQYCPADPVTRRQMAVFLERAKKSSLYAPPPAVGIFADVPTNSQFAAFIEALYNDGITQGCLSGPLRYCPDIAVSRAAMAKFLLKAKCGAAYVPNTPASSPFADVANNDPFLNWINKIYTLGITAGCKSAPLRFCPTAPVTRAAMAKFMESAFPDIVPSQACSP
jgi:hypothetical protein